MKSIGPSHYLFIRFFALVACMFIATISPAQQILHVAVAGLAHDHVHGILNQYKKGEVVISRYCRIR